jgi:hypothetical protein
MENKELKFQQNKRLEKLCLEKDVNFKSLNVLLKAVKTKKILKRNSYLQQKLNDIIEKGIK